jgi:hypothetical protein
MNVFQLVAALTMAGMVTLGGCTAAVTAAVVADAPTLIATATTLLDNYKATPTPSASVVAEATDLLAAAEAANSTYGATSSQALAAAAALTAYLATSAPGNGVTPSTVPTAG